MNIRPDVPNFEHLNVRWARLAHADLDVADTTDQAGRLYAQHTGHSHIKQAFNTQLQRFAIQEQLGAMLKSTSDSEARDTLLDPKKRAALTATDWLAIESNIVSATIRKALDAPYSDSMQSAAKYLDSTSSHALNVPSSSFGTVTQHIKATYTTDIVVRSEHLDTVSDIALIWFPFAAFAFAVGILHSAAFTFTGLPQYACALTFLTLALHVLLGIIARTIVLRKWPDVDRNAALLSAVSPTWDQVLKMQTPADCLLLAQLYQVLRLPYNATVSLFGISVQQACKLAFAHNTDRKLILALLTNYVPPQG